MPHRWPLVALVAVSLWSPALAQDLVIPRLDSVELDGKASEWDAALRAPVLLGEGGRLRRPENFEPTVRLGWDERGLLVLAVVTDDAHREHPISRHAPLGDCLTVEVDAEGGRPVTAHLLPGADPSQPSARSFVAWRGGSSSDSAAQLAATSSREGYTLEALLPWETLGLKQPADRVRVRVIANDQDGAGRVFRAAWPGGEQPAADARLGEQASGPPVAVAVELPGLEALRVTVAGPAELAGKVVDIRAGDQHAQASLNPQAGRAAAQVRLSAPPAGQPAPAVNVNIGDQALGAVAIEDIQMQRARVAAASPIVVRPMVFAGSTPPAAEAGDPQALRRAVGPFTLQTDYYTGRFDPTRSAEADGRYGAVVRIQPESGPELRRFVTLYRAPSAVDWSSYQANAQLELPESLGIDRGVSFEQSHVVGAYIQRLLRRGIEQDEGAARLLAGLYETLPGAGQGSFQDSPAARDRAWWAQMRRRLGELGEAPMLGAPQMDQPRPTLRYGQAGEAGLSAQQVGELEQVFRDWAQQSPGGFSVTVARDGVAVISAGFGGDHQGPINPDASLPVGQVRRAHAIALAGAMAMRGLVDLDAPLDAALPGLADLREGEPITLRHLLTQTAGLTGDWPEAAGDLPERAALGYAIAQPDATLGNAQAELAMAVSLMETAGGRSFAQLCNELLLQPLDCDVTRIEGIDNAVYASSIDLARVGQLLLNGGVYGEARLFDEDYAAALRPEPSDDAAAPLSARRPLGVALLDELLPTDVEREGAAPFGLVAANGSALIVDPQTRLVLAIGRTQADPQYELHLRKALSILLKAGGGNGDDQMIFDEYGPGY